MSAGSHFYSGRSEWNIVSTAAWTRVSAAGRRSAVREPRTPTYVTRTTLLFLCVYVHGGTKSHSLGVNVRAIIHFRGHKCQRASCVAAKGTFFILQILMSYYLFVAVCHIINLLVRQSVYAAPHRIIDEYFIMPQINSNARTKIYCKRLLVLELQHSRTTYKHDLKCVPAARFSPLLLAN